MSIWKLYFPRVDWGFGSCFRGQRVDDYTSRAEASVFITSGIFWEGKVIRHLKSRNSWFIAALFGVGLILYSLTAEAGGLRISPEMELLAGVLSQTTWGTQHGPSGEGNEYYRALKSFFAPYKNHKAVTLAQELTAKGFTYDAPPAFVCHLGSLPELDVIHEYSDYVVKRAGGRQKLEKFRLALRDLAEESGFVIFFKQWMPYLDEIVRTANVGFRPDVVTEWLEDFFGWPAEEFHLIMTPSMFPAGGYGATITTEDNRLIAYQIIREQGSSNTKPQFPSGIWLEDLTIHELGHSFVNPSMEAYPTRANHLKPLMWPVRKIMYQQAYISIATFLNEQVLRSVQVTAAHELYGPEIREQIITYNEQVGFYLTQFVAEQLQFYQANRDRYPTFRDFVPYLYDQLDSYQKDNSSFRDRVFGIFIK